MKISVFISNPASEALNFSEEKKELLEMALPDVDVVVCDTPKSFKENLIDTDIALTWYFSLKWLEKAPKLKWIAVPSAGTDYMNIEFPDHIKFTNSSFHGEIMAETVLGALLGFSRGLFWINKNQEKLLWPNEQHRNMAKTLRGSHLVIVGFGHIGTHIARLAKPFGVKITGVKRTLIKKPNFFDESDNIITIENLDSVLPETDHLIMVLPKNKSTDTIINRERLSLLPKTAYLYNIGRGNAIDENALIDALNENRISGAYLDVFQNEPLKKDSPLRKCPNILLTPHTSAIGPNFLRLFIEEFVEKYNKWISS
jgi:phosphoglycerate dehydrogenase-like enzyme